MKSFYSVLTLVFVSLIVGCSIENASTTEKKKLTIVSDYLKKKDTTLFADFKTKFKVDIKIINKSTDEVIGAFRNRSFATGIDIIMIRSLNDINRLAKLNYFQSVERLSDDLEIKPAYLSNKYDYIGFGIDPFVFAHNPDSSLLHRVYHDCTLSPFATDLKDEELIPLFASLMSKLDKVESYTWIKSFKAQQKTVSALKYGGAKTYLTTYSHYQTRAKKDSTIQSLSRIQFPNQSGLGAFYNLRTFAIVTQAENYTTATEFISFYTSGNQNKTLTKELNVLSLSEGETKIRLYRTKSEDLLQYYNMIQRILNKIN